MKILLLLVLVLVALTSARYVQRPAKDSKETVRCQARVEQYPVRGLRLQQANDDTNKVARSYYSGFSIQKHFIRNDNGKTSQFQVAIEYKTPKKEYLSGNKQVKINFYNLLFTASLKINAERDGCQGTEYSFLGFVELVKTDITWYKGRNNITEHRQCNLPTDNQYVMTKLKPQNDGLFANDTVWGRTVLISKDQPRMVPLKYESSENIVVDYEKHQDTIYFEKLIEKKIFIVQTNLLNEVLDVVAGVDVMIYLNTMTYNFTDAPHLQIAANHSLIRRIADPQKYVSVINKLNTKAVREQPSCHLNVPWSGTSTLNPIPKGVRIYTE